jgi:hypothetical protein
MRKVEDNTDEAKETFSSITAAAAVATIMLLLLSLWLMKLWSEKRRF